LTYNINKPIEPEVQDSEAHFPSLFDTMEFLEIDAKNIYISLLHIADFIKSREVQAGFVDNISQLKDLGEAMWNFISSIYKAKWDSIDIDGNSFFRTRVSSKFTPKVLKTKSLSTSDSSKEKVAEIVKCYDLKPLGLDNRTTLCIELHKRTQ